MEMLWTDLEEQNKRRGIVTSIIIHVLLLLLLIIPFIHYSIPPPGQQGILVSLGLPDEGEGQDTPDTQNEEKTDPQQAKSEAEEVEPAKVEVVDKQARRSTTEPQRQPDVLTSESPEDIAIRNRKAEEARQKAIQRQIEIEAQKERDRIAEAERKKAEEAAAKQAAFDKTKKQYSDLLGGTGKGNTGTPGNQGDPGGDPNAGALTGISTGSGMVGGGLGDRGVLFEPEISDNSQKTGRVVVNVCVDKTGNVTSSNYTQRGSTTTDLELRSLAEKSAEKFKFTPSDIEKQCGTVTIDFKLK